MKSPILSRKCRRCRKYRPLGRFPSFANVCRYCRLKSVSSAQRKGRYTATQQLVQNLKALGYQVLTNGWPDALIMRNGQARFVEFKQPGEKLRRSQAKMHGALLRHFGYQVRIIRVTTNAVEAVKKLDRYHVSGE